MISHQSDINSQNNDEIETQYQVTSYKNVEDLINDRNNDEIQGSGDGTSPRFQSSAW